MANVGSEQLAERIRRWQVLTVARGRISDIRNYDNEAAAAFAAGLA